MGNENDSRQGIDHRDLLRGLLAWLRIAGVAATRTRIVKFLYLADLQHARHHGGHHLTGWSWRVDKFGPLALEALRLLDQGVAEGWLRATAPLSNEPDEAGRAMFYDLPDENIEAVADALPAGLGKVRTWIRKYGDDTNRLLRFVYASTEPMADAHDGDELDFSKANAVPPPGLLRGRQLKKPEKTRFFALLDQIRQRHEHAQREADLLQDGPRDDAYSAGLPAEGDGPVGQIILDFPQRRGGGRWD
jgi:hypothetical protein